MEYTPPRPRVTEQMILDACMEVAPRLTESEDEAECLLVAQSIARVYKHPMDGFQIAKQLDMREDWDTTRDDADRLDSLEMHVRRALEAAEKEWFEANDIKPPHPVGAAITIGVIEGVYKYQPGYYTVKENGCTQDGRFRIVRFEDAKEPA